MSPNAADRPDREPLRLGVTGVGGRGARLLELLVEMDDVAVPAVCDVQQRHRRSARETVTASDRPAPDAYEEHGALIERDDLDGVVVATPWSRHLPMAIAAMEAGLDVGIEVGPASSVEECRRLVATAERTGNRCMLLENCCYYRDTMAILRMVRQGLFGELIHCQCGYGHDLRSQIVTGNDTALDRAGGRNYRGVHHEKRNGDLYPTHGIGPVAKWLGINRGNRFASLTATASKARGLADWAETELDADHPARDVDWAHGDVVTTVLRCANGETVVLTHDVSLPRPYSNMYQVQGTGGLWRRTFESIGEGGIEMESSIHLEERSPGHQWEPSDDYLEEHEHPLWTAYREAGVRAGHGGVDHLVLRDFVTSLREGGRLPIDVYDAAAWMAITPLSERSIALGGDAVEFPDFTDGEWMYDEPTFGRYDGDLPL